MDKNLMALELRETEVLEHNKNIDVRVVRAQAKLECELRELGVEVKPEFKVEPPLGRGTMRLRNQNF